MSDLANRECAPCKGGVPPLTPEQIAPLQAQIEGWNIVDDHHLEKRYKLKNFAEALDQVANL